MWREFLWILLGHGHLTAQDLLPLLPDSEILKKDIHLKSSESPEVSIIIPVYNQLAYTYNCLLSLREKISTHIQYEIIVIDDCSTDSTHTFFMSNATGIVYIRNMDNMGFLRSCNKAASQAKGRFLCFLNNDTQARNGWLENLLKTFFTDQAVGCAGSKLIFPNGLLQEAGGIIYRNGSTDRYGSLEPADLLRFNKAKEVDYCSGASLMIRKTDFERLHCLDDQYTPAYYEDTDLCMGVKHILGKKIIYQPQSQIVHFEKISSIQEAVSSLLHNNRHKFKNKWRIELLQHSEIP
ncbi:glycosyltransferase family 2 protein [Pararcticibacter amylolyticus]|nr:glycosyltransferase family 2 protein [Pararcticibacter amylolyticus]